MQRIYFPKMGSQPFGYLVVEPKNFDLTKPVRGVCVFHGQGECGPGDLKSLQALGGWPGWYVNDTAPSLFNSVDKYNIVLILVQTTVASKFGSGEMDFAMKQLASRYKLIGKPAMMGVSLGGFGMINWLSMSEMFNDTLILNTARISFALFIMPGGNGNIGANMPDNVSAAKLKCLFVHAIDDKVALPVQSIKLNNEIFVRNTDLSELVLYSTGGHSIADRPMNAYYPWSMVQEKWPMEAVSYRPTESIYSSIIKAGGEPIPVPDKLKLLIRVYEKPDGTLYSEDEIVQPF